jgi:hypothetical protein
MTPKDTGLFISFIREALCIMLYRVWPAMVWFAPFLSLVEMGGQFQSPCVPFGAAHFCGAMRAESLDVIGLDEDNNCPSLWLGILLVIFSAHYHKPPIGGIKFYLV